MPKLRAFVSPAALSRAAVLTYLLPASVVFSALLPAGCMSTAQSATLARAPVPSASGAAPSLQAGDVLKLTFPGAPALDSSQEIRPDGKVTLPLVGELPAAGRTAADMEQELLRLYGPQLVAKEMTLVVVPAGFHVYVTGSVIRPGKVDTRKPLNAFEAIMEAGGFDYTKADLQKVLVIRHEGGRVQNYRLNLKPYIEGTATEAFDLKAGDTLYIPEKFSWF